MEPVLLRRHPGRSGGKTQAVPAWSIPHRYSGVVPEEDRELSRAGSLSPPSNAGRQSGAVHLAYRLVEHRSAELVEAKEAEGARAVVIENAQVVRLVDVLLDDL